MNRVFGFKQGCVAGIPIGLGYFAVSFALGIAAADAGMNAPQSFFMSAGMVASAGEFAAIELIRTGAGVVEIILTCLIVNLRYLLMSCSLTQKLSPDMKFAHRFGLAYCITDEIFALSSAVPGGLNPFYTYGITLVSVSGWCLGTVLGVTAGNILPERVVGALSVSLYGMFLAIIIPPSKKNAFIGAVVAISMLLSFVFSVTPVLREISSGFRIIILTILIASAAAVIHPEENVTETEK